MKRIALILIFIAFFVSACGAPLIVPEEISGVAPLESLSPETVPGSTPEPTPEPTPVPTPVPTPEPDPIEALIAQMSDEELIGQMVMIGFTGTKNMDEQSIVLMQKYDVGNVILFGWNTKTFSQTSSLVEKINAHNKSSIPLIIGIDIEGGRVIRFSKWRKQLKSAFVLGAKGEPEQVYEQYRSIGEKLKDMGITLNMAPVLDIAEDPMKTFIGDRMFGSEPQEVSMLIREAIKGLQDAGITCMGKHFPGHGETTDDSHKKLPVIKASFEDIEGYALKPFEEAVQASIDAMLIAHLSYPEIDSGQIASMSSFWITQVLREKMGFDGVVFSDDMRMKGITIKYSAGEGAVAHILAGGDIVLIGKHIKMQKDVLESLRRAAAENIISRERLEQSVRRILRMKFKYNAELSY